MWFNSMIREKPYQFQLGVAWLSSDRVVRCEAKARNGRNPYLQFTHQNNKSYFEGLRDPEFGFGVKFFESSN